MGHNGERHEGQHTPAELKERIGRALWLNGLPPSDEHVDSYILGAAVSLAAYRGYIDVEMSKQSAIRLAQTVREHLEPMVGELMAENHGRAFLTGLATAMGGDSDD